MMTEEQALEIINQVRINNPFTMGLTIDEFIQNFKKRYLQMHDVILPCDYVSIAKLIQELN